MKIKNNTKKDLIFSFGNFAEEEPETTTTILIGEELNLDHDDCSVSNISITEE